MRVRRVWLRACGSGLVLVIGVVPTRNGWARAASLGSSGFPGSSGARFEVKGVTVSSVGASLTFDVSFLDPSSILGPVAGTSASSVYGVFHLDDDRGQAPGPAPDPSADGVLSLTAEGPVLAHHFPLGRVDRLRDAGGAVLDSVSITYGASPERPGFALTFSDVDAIPGFESLGAGEPVPFSVVVGLADHESDVLPTSSATIPEPSSVALIAEAGVAMAGVKAIRARRQKRLLDPAQAR